MNINERFGVNNDTPHDKKYELIVNAIGLNKVLDCLPYGLTKDIIKKEVEKGNIHLNGSIKVGEGYVTIKTWDRSAGFVTNGADCKMVGSSLLRHLAQIGINVVSCSECVCILKRAALMSIA